MMRCISEQPGRSHERARFRFFPNAFDCWLSNSDIQICGACRKDHVEVSVQSTYLIVPGHDATRNGDARMSPPL
jgi:hypothetical protein